MQTFFLTPLIFLDCRLIFWRLTVLILEWERAASLVEARPQISHCLAIVFYVKNRGIRFLLIFKTRIATNKIIIYDRILSCFAEKGKGAVFLCHLKIKTGLFKI